jgi:hypothetical protein
MANYYPLLARAVSGMQDSTAEQRTGLYDRARHALLAQLQAADPPLSESDITRERLELEDAIRRVEDEASGLPALAPIPEPAPEPVFVDEPVDQPEFEELPPQPARPRVEPRQSGGGKRSFGFWLVLGLLVPITAGMGFLAYRLNKAEPQPVTASAPASTPAAPESSKVTERLGGEASGGTPAETPGQTVASAPVEASQPGVAVAQRAVLLQEDPADAQKVIAKQGNVAWRLDTESPGSGQQLETVVKASFDFTDERLHGEVVFRRNTDQALPASHTVEIRFTPEAGSSVGNVKAVGLLEAREDDHTRGTVLGGSQFPVSENLFLIGLSNAEPIRSSNIELLRSRNWFYLEMQFSSGRRGAVILERGDVGKRIFAEALAAWQQ